MNKLTYPMFILKNHRGFFFFSAVVIAALQFVIIELISSMDTVNILKVLFEQLPERFQAFVNESFLINFSLKGAAAFGFNHPMVLVLLAISAINIPNQHITGELESGTLELLLAHPIKRTRLLIWLWLSGSLFLFLIIGSALLGSFSALTLKGEITADFVQNMLQIGVNLWLLFVFIMTYTLLMATFVKEGRKTGMYSAGLTFTFFFLHLLSTLWDKINFIKPFNIFTYYQPQKLMFGQQSFWLNACVLGSLTAICLFLSVRQFERRDIPG